MTDCQLYIEKKSVSAPFFDAYTPSKAALERKGQQDRIASTDVRRRITQGRTF